MNLGIRKFPFPYKCALSISSDIDNASSSQSFIDFMNFLNSDGVTKYGTGLNLEIGNSFWFFNNSNFKQLSYFKNLTSEETSFAPTIRSLWRSGHIDTIHSWGNFDKGGFERKYAKIGLKILNEYNVKIPVWINHGIGKNYQKIGNYIGMYGDKPKNDNYHSDLLMDIGCEYIWTGKVTHIIGQNSKWNPSILLKTSLQWLLKQTKYRYIKQPIYDSGNTLLHPVKLGDANLVWEFVRFINPWGRAGILDIYEFVDQIRPTILQRLIKNEGIMVIYTHFNENLKKDLPKKLILHLNELKNLVAKKDILLATTSRLLKFWEIRNYLSYSLQENKDHNQIIIRDKLKNPIGTKIIKESHLQGLTFYIDTKKPCVVRFKNKVCETRLNPPDQTGKTSIAIPWKDLKYPDLNNV
tara:strand:- start:2258 stop:3487 length:1230 start_codon:yes stop_codon:yes gene_type:complete